MTRGCHFGSELTVRLTKEFKTGAQLRGGGPIEAAYRIILVPTVPEI
jgi:hypothetical protein